MKGRIIVLLVLLGLTMSVQSAYATQDIGEGYARPTYKELVQTFILLNGYDINDSKIADEYGRVVYCKLYQKNFSNDIAWKRIRDQITTRAQKKKEYFRVKYEIISSFELGRYDFSKQYFPLDPKAVISNAGNISLFISGELKPDCSGREERSIVPSNITLDLSEPLTVTGFSVPADKVEKMMVRIEEAGNVDRRIYGRIRVIITDAEKGQSFSSQNFQQAVLKGRVTSVDFFIDPELTKPLGGVQYGRE